MHVDSKLCNVFKSCSHVLIGGSFRHFMWHMARELQGPHLGLLIPCPSSAANKNKVKNVFSVLFEQ